MALSFPNPRFKTPQKIKQISKPALTSVKNSSKSQPHLTPPTATIAMPLLNPKTDTGMFLSVVEPSPTCASKMKCSQTKTRLPRTPSQPPQNQTTCITWPFPLFPQHKTPPLLDSAQE